MDGFHGSAVPDGETWAECIRNGGSPKSASDETVLYSTGTDLCGL